MLIKKGDKLRCIHTNDVNGQLSLNKVYVAQSNERRAPFRPTVRVIDNNGGETDFYIFHFRVINKPETINKLENNNTNKHMNNIINFIKTAARPEPEKILVKAGIIDESYALTSTGKDVLWGMLYEQNKDKLKEIAEEFIKEEEEEEGKK